MPKSRDDWESAISSFAKGKAGRAYLALGLGTVPVPPLRFTRSPGLAATNISDDGTVRDITFYSKWVKRNYLETVVQLLLMELGNVKNAAKFAALDAAVEKDRKALRALPKSRRSIEAKKYARANEMLEWLHVRQLLVQIDSDPVFATTRHALFKGRPADFEAYYAAQMRTGDAYPYIESWFAIVGRAVPEALEREMSR